MAEQLELFAITSPCVGICQTDKRGYCTGCFRSRDERFLWQKMSNSEKNQVLRLCHNRKVRSARPAHNKLSTPSTDQFDFD